MKAIVHKHRRFIYRRLHMMLRRGNFILRFLRPDFSLKEIRPTGSYVQIAANGDPHSEDAGDQTAIVLFSFRGSTGDRILYQDQASNVEFRLGFPDFQAVLAHQIATGATANLAARAA